MSSETMPDLVSQPGFEMANQLAAKKERSIIKALDYVFGTDEWDEQGIAGQCELKCLPDGTELFLIHGRPMIYFEKLETDVVISYKSIFLLFRQPIRELF